MGYLNSDHLNASHRIRIDVGRKEYERAYVSNTPGLAVDPLPIRLQASETVKMQTPYIHAPRVQ